MATKYIAVVGAEKINQFDSFLNKKTRMSNGDDFVLVAFDESTQITYPFIEAYDLIIRAALRKNVESLPILQNGKVVNLPKYTKEVQGYYISCIDSEITTELYTGRSFNPSLELAKSKTVIVKPTTGALSIGVFTIPSNTLKRCMYEMGAVFPTGSKVTISEYKAHVESYGGKVLVTKENTRNNALISKVFNNGVDNNFVVSTFIESDTGSSKEIRVIWNGISKTGYLFERSKHEAVKYQLASSALTEKFSHLPLTFGSIDLLITDKGEYLLEFQNQFGIRNLDSEDFFNIVVSFIESALASSEATVITSEPT